METNPYSANEEDGATFDRLKRELEENGMLHIPTVIAPRDWKPNDDTRLPIMHGAHRIAAWFELGHGGVDCHVVTPTRELTPEEMFNVVNNANLVHGHTTTRAVRQKVRMHELDPTKLDLFKFPVSSLLPRMDSKAPDTDLTRRARIREMALVIAHKVAEPLLDHMDDAVVAFRVEDKAVAVVRVSLSATATRKNIAPLKAQLEHVFSQWLVGDTEYTEEAVPFGEGPFADELFSPE